MMGSDIMVPSAAVNVSCKIEHNGRATDDGNGIHLNADGTVTIQCVSNAPMIQWTSTSSGDDGFTSTNASIIVNTVATYTCTASVPANGELL